MSLENAILETLAYSDMFDYPLTLDELHRYLVAPADREDVSRCAAAMKEVRFHEGYYFLTGRSEILDVRKMREAASRRVLARAVFFGRILASLPFVRMVALTGSLAVLNLAQGADMDYMLVTQAGRLWTARAFAVTFGRTMRPFGQKICVNLLVSERALTWPRHGLYSAREMCQMLPIAGTDVYRRLRAANDWTESVLPNAGSSAPNFLQIAARTRKAPARHLLESRLVDKRGDRLEEWARNYQMRRIARRTGGAGETHFTADVCQGHFHNHRRWTDESFRARLASLGLVNRAPEFAEASSML